MKFIIEHLSKRFEQKEVLKDIDFTFEEGRIYGLLGRNGAGKTTLFNCLNRDIKADSGSFYIEENGVRREVAAEDIGYVLSTPTVPEFLTGREFLKFFVDINADSIRDPRPLDEYFAEMSIAPALVSTRSGWTKPVTARPYLGSSSRMLWPPVMRAPAS